MFGGIDLLGLFDWPVIQPKDDVSVIVEIGACHGHWLVGVMGEDGKRASRIEADTTN